MILSLSEPNLFNNIKSSVDKTQKLVPNFIMNVTKYHNKTNLNILRNTTFSLYSLQTNNMKLKFENGATVSIIYFPYIKQIVIICK